MTRKNKQKRVARSRQARFGGSYSSHLHVARSTSGQRPPTVRECIEAILVRARERRAAYEAWVGTVPDGNDRMRQLIHVRLPGPTGSDHPHAAVWNEYQHRERGLHEALHALSEDVLRKVQAVMYVGRDDDDYERLIHLLRDEQHAVRAHRVAEKVPVDGYLEEGLRLVDVNSLEIERPLPSE